MHVRMCGGGGSSLCVCICVRAWGACVRSEDNFHESVLSSHHVVWESSFDYQAWEQVPLPAVSCDHPLFAFWDRSFVVVGDVFCSLKLCPRAPELVELFGWAWEVRLCWVEYVTGQALTFQPQARSLLLDWGSSYEPPLLFLLPSWTLKPSEP